MIAPAFLSYIQQRPRCTGRAQAVSDSRKAIMSSLFVMIAGPATKNAHQRPQVAYRHSVRDRPWSAPPRPRAPIRAFNFRPVRRMHIGGHRRGRRDGIQPRWQFSRLPGTPFPVHPHFLRVTIAGGCSGSLANYTHSSPITAIYKPIIVSKTCAYL